MRSKYLILLIVSVFLAVLFFTTSAAMLDKTNREITRVDRQIRSVQEQLNSAKVLNEDLKEVSNVIENSLTNARDLATEEVNEFIRELTEFAFIHEIAVLSITPRALFNQNRIIEQQFTLELECTYVQLGQYLATIEKYDYIVKVNTLEVRPQAERFREIRGERHVLYRVTLDLSIFKIIREA